MPHFSPLDKAAIAAASHQGISISELWNHYQATMGSSPKSLSDAILELLKIKRAGGRSKLYCEQLEWALNNFSSYNGPQELVDKVQRTKVETWILQGNALSASTKASRLRTLFRFCKRRGYCRESPVDAIELPRIIREPPAILSNTSWSKLLQTATDIDSDLLLYLWLCGVVGLRRVEAMRIPESAIRIKEGVVEVGATVAKNRSRRLAELPGTLPFKGTDLPAKNYERNFRKRFDAILRAAELCDWKRNCLRHTAASHLINYLFDAQRAALSLGNSPAMLHRHYRALVTKAETEEFYRISAEHL